MSKTKIKSEMEVYSGDENEYYVILHGSSESKTEDSTVIRTNITARTNANTTTSNALQLIFVDSTDFHR
jgi:hypothetical protein